MKNYLQNILKEYKKYFPEEENNFKLLEKQLKNDENLWIRKNFNGHITSDAYILNKDLTKIILIYNINLNKWLAPGGHWEEGDGEIQNNAKREAEEETGLKNLSLHIWHKKNNFIPIDIYTHYIPENFKKKEKSHYHHGFRYIFIYNGNIDDISLQENEVKGFKWVDMDKNIKNFSGNNVLEKIRKII